MRTYRISKYNPILKKIILVFIIAFSLLETLMAQEINLPERISISDKFFSPWVKSLLYEYDLLLNGSNYTVQRTTLEENGNKDNRDQNIGTVDIQLIKEILITIGNHPSKRVNPSDFQKSFALDSINDFLNKHGNDYWITNDFQKQFIREQLTDPVKLKFNLEMYFKEYDHSYFIDGSSTEIKIDFHFKDSILSVSSKSILQTGLPIEVNGEKSFSPNLASLIGELIPKSKTNRKAQFSGERLFSDAIIKTIGNNRRTLDNLESKSFQVYVDSLKTMFQVSNIRVVNGISSTNWNGEKRLSCKLRDKSVNSNVLVSYSTSIKNGAILYPVSLIMENYSQLYLRTMSSTFFNEYLAENKERELSIIYDDNSCFTDQSRKSAMNDCKLTGLSIDFENAVFISLKSELGNISHWGLLPNGQYFMWWNDGNPPRPIDDENYLKCE
jgi:hypothetical protein